MPQRTRAEDGMDKPENQLAATRGTECETSPQECYLAAPGGIKIHLSPETGAIIPPGRSPEEIRVWIASLINAMTDDPSGHNDFQLKHTFLNGMYMREMFIPKGTLLVGKIHKMDCMNIVSSGDISVLTELGSARVGAGYSSVSPAGIQKVGYAHEDTVFVNVFRTDAACAACAELEIAADSRRDLVVIDGGITEKTLCQLE